MLIRRWWSRLPGHHYYISPIYYYCTRCILLYSYPLRYACSCCKLKPIRDHRVEASKQRRHQKGPRLRTCPTSPNHASPISHQSPFYQVYSELCNRTASEWHTHGCRITLPNIWKDNGSKTKSTLRKCTQKYVYLVEDPINEIFNAIEDLE